MLPSADFHLMGTEVSERIDAVARGLEAGGARVEETADSLTVHGMGPGGLPGGATNIDLTVRDVWAAQAMTEALRRQLARDNAIHTGLRTWARWSSRNLDAGRAQHGWLAWSFAALGPVVLAQNTTLASAEPMPVLGDNDADVEAIDATGTTMVFQTAESNITVIWVAGLDEDGPDSGEQGT